MIRYAEARDREAWYALDRHLPADGFDEKVRNRQGYVCLADGGVIGVLRWNLFWDSTPFCNLLFIDAAYRGRGYGRALVERWERDMASAGYRVLMTSTRADEGAQHFYRKLGYRDRGGFLPDDPDTGDAQPLEIIMSKVL